MKIEQSKRIAILRAAIRGDSVAQQAILAHFESYINALSTVTLYEEGGRSQTYLDEDIKISLQEKLIRSLEHFDLDGVLEKNYTEERNAHLPNE